MQLGADRIVWSGISFASDQKLFDIFRPGEFHMVLLLSHENPGVCPKTKCWFRCMLYWIDMFFGLLIYDTPVFEKSTLPCTCSGPTAGQPTGSSSFKQPSQRSGAFVGLQKSRIKIISQNLFWIQRSNRCERLGLFQQYPNSHCMGMIPSYDCQDQESTKQIYRFHNNQCISILLVGIYGIVSLTSRKLELDSELQTPHRISLSKITWTSLR